MKWLKFRAPVMRPDIQRIILMSRSAERGRHPPSTVAVARDGSINDKPNALHLLCRYAVARRRDFSTNCCEKHGLRLQKKRAHHSFPARACRLIKLLSWNPNRLCCSQEGRSRGTSCGRHIARKNAV